MVPIGGPSIYYHLIMSSVDNGARAGFLVLRPGAEEVGTVDDVGVHGCRHHHQLSVVFLGLLAHILTYGPKRLHWGPCSLWFEEYIGESEPWVSSNPQPAVLVLPGAPS